MKVTPTLRACLITGALVAGITAAAGPGFAVAAAESV